MAFEPKATGYPQLILEDGIFSDSTTKKYQLGQKAIDVNGNEYRYVRASEAIAVGEIVTHGPKDTWDTAVLIDGAVSVGATKVTVDGGSTAFTVNQYQDYYFSLATTLAAKGFLHRIEGHASGTAGASVVLKLTHPAMEAFLNNAILDIYNPFLVELTDADTEIIVGVAIGTIASDSYGFVQIGGIHPGVLCDGSNGTAVVLNEPIVPYGSDPGQGQGVTENDSTSDFEVANSPLIALGSSTVDAGYIPAKFVRNV